MQPAEGASTVRNTGAILVIEDEPDLRELLEVLLADEGHSVATASDGAMALDLVKRGMIRPDLILADFNLPTGMDGIHVARMLREELHQAVPTIILTGDISTRTLGRIAAWAGKISTGVPASAEVEVVRSLKAVTSVEQHEGEGC